MDSGKVKGLVPLSSVKLPSMTVNTEHNLAAFASASKLKVSMSGLDNPV